MPKLHAYRIAAFALAAILPFQPAALRAATTYEVHPTYGHVSFTITKWMVFEEEGRFKDVRGSILFDRENPASSRVQIVVRTASLDTNNSTRDDVVESDDFLDVARYPTMTFVSTAVIPAGETAFDVTGDLTIHGVTRRITIRANLRGLTNVPDVGELAGFESSFSVKRTDFGVNGTRWSGGRAILGDEVRIHMRIGGIHRR